MPHLHTTTEKLCPHCNQIKAVDAFGKCKPTPDGLQTYCKACRNAMQAVVRTTKEYQQYSRQYENLPHQKAYRKAYNLAHYTTEKRRAYVARHKDRQRARDVVRWNVKKGQMPKVNTMQCGSVFQDGKFTHTKGNCNAQAAHYHHHLGYEVANHLSVEALCTTCHGLAHQKRDTPEPIHAD